MYMYICIYIYADGLSLITPSHPQGALRMRGCDERESICICIYVYMYVYIFIYIYILIYTYIYIYINIYIYFLYIYIYINKYINIYILPIAY